MEEEPAEEVAAARILRGPKDPTEAERDQHEATEHAVFRSWCRHCLASKGLGQQHRNVIEVGEVPELCMDYCYLGDDTGDKDAKSLCHLVCKDNRYKMYFATCLEAKGVSKFNVDLVI